MKFAWCTDIHLNFLNEDACRSFYQSIADTNCDGVFVTGDVLTRAALDNPSIEYLVLCGHTHSDAYFQPLETLTANFPLR